MKTVFLQIPQIHMPINKCECIAREFMVRDGNDCLYDVVPLFLCTSSMIGLIW